MAPRQGTMASPVAWEGAQAKLKPGCLDACLRSSMRGRFPGTRASVRQALAQRAQFWQRAPSRDTPSSARATASWGQASAQRRHSL